MKRLLLLVAIMAVFWPMKTVRGSINNVYTDPNQPTDKDSITIIVSGIGGTPVWIDDSDYRREGTSLELDIFFTFGPFGAITPWSHSEVIGTLPANFYDLTVRQYTYDELTGTYFLSDTYSASFTVISEQPLEATVEIEPHTLNLQSKGKWLTCYIWLPEDYNIADIEPNSIVLESEPNDIHAEWLWFDEYEQLAMAKFKRSEVQDILSVGEVELTISGELTDGTIFEGTDVIRVIDKGGKKK